MSKPTHLDRLRAIERALAKSEDQTAAIDAALEETRKAIALERARTALKLKLVALGGPPDRENSRSVHNSKRLNALVATGTKLGAASALAKSAMIDIAASGLFPVEVRKDLRKIATDIDTYIQRQITSTIEHIP